MSRTAKPRTNKALNRQATRYALALLVNARDAIMREDVVQPFHRNPKRKCSCSNCIRPWH